MRILKKTSKRPILRIKQSKRPMLSNDSSNTKINKVEQPPNSTAIMKESTADNRPHPSQPNPASNPVTSQATKANVPASSKPAKSSGGKSGFPWKTPQTTTPQAATTADTTNWPSLSEQPLATSTT